MSEDSFETCPVCGTSLSEGIEECPECGAILELFDIDVEDEVEEDSMEKIMDMMLDEDEEKELIEDIKELGLSEDEVPYQQTFEGEEEIEEEPEEVEEVITFECPVCESEVAEDTVECPNCGAIFEESTEETVKEEKTEGIDQEIGELEEGFDEELEKEEESESVDFKDDIESFESELQHFEYASLDIGYIEKDLESLKKAQEENKKEEGEKLVRELQENLDLSREIKEKIGRSQRYVEALSEKIDASKFEERIEEIYQGTEIGEYQAAHKKAKELENEIKERIYDESEEWLKTLIEDKIEKTEENLTETNSKIDLEHIEDEIKSAKSAKKDGKIDKALHETFKSLHSSEDVLEISTKLEEVNFYEEKLKQRDVDIEKFTDEVDRSLDKMGKIETSHIIDEIENTIEEMNEKLEREKEIERISRERQRKDLFKKIQQKIPKMKSLLKTAKDFDIETEEGKGLINEAVEFTKQNDYEKAVEKLNKCRGLFQEKLDRKIDKKIKRFKETEEKSTSEIHIDDIEKYKQKGDYERALGLIDETEREIKFQQNPMGELNDEISKLENILDCAKELGFETHKCELLAEKAEKEKTKENWDESQKKIEECKESLEDILLDFLKGEIQSAKKELKEAKKKGKDVSEPIDLLKEANELQKENDLEGSFNAVYEYQKKMDEMREKL